MKVGVLEGTTSEQFLRQNYPNARITTFNSADGRNKAIKKVRSGDLDAYISDLILIMGEINRQGLNKSDYKTIPDNPLTCEYYGLILPTGDLQWRNKVNTFIRDRTSEQAFERWLDDYYPQSVSDLDYCQNRANDNK